MTNELITYFPENLTPRPQQEEVLKKIDAEIKKGTKFIVLNAPTGFGKSVVSKTLANASPEASDEFKKWVDGYGPFFKPESHVEYNPFGCMALTITKNLQDQYTNDFADSKSYKGKSNYQCQYDTDYDVEDAPCNSSKNLKHECFSCDRCTYYKEKKNTIYNKFSILNYALFLNLQDNLKYRKFLVLDEASEIEDEIVRNFTLELNYEKLEKLDIYIRKIEEDAPIPKLSGWLQDLIDKCNAESEAAKRKLCDKKSRQFLKNSTKYRILQRLLNKVKLVSDGLSHSEYVVEKTEDEKGVSLTPIYVDNLSGYIFDFADHVILMSATIIDHAHFCKTLGITKYAYIESNSIFDPNKSPIRCIGKYPLTYKVIDKNLPHVVDIAKMICEDEHPKEKGIIHTNSFKITQAYKNKLKGTRYLYREHNMKNEHLVEIHKDTDKPTVLISPSMTHGVDLKGDLGRFQIISKIPYLPLNNKRIKILSKRDYRWYINRTISTLIQACGRCTRTKDDEVQTYIIDGSIIDILKRNKKKIPQYFLDRFV